MCVYIFRSFKFQILGQGTFTLIQCLLLYLELLFSLSLFISITIIFTIISIITVIIIKYIIDQFSLL